jgi:group I intron endonuclease
MVGIYCIEIGERVYIGSSQNIAKRLSEHRKALESGTHYNLKLQRAWVKHGPGEFAIVEVCERDELIEREQFWIDELRCVELGLNLSPTAGSPRGCKRSEESNEKTRQSFKNMSPEKRAEWIRKCRESNLGKKRSEETRARMSAAQRIPKTISDETREKLREANRNRSEETRRKLSEAAKNRSPESIEKMREALSGRAQSEESNQKRSEALRAYWARRREERALTEDVIS